MEICVNHTEGSQGGLEMTLSGVISQVVLPAVCVFGIVGNTLNLAILTRRKLQKSFRILELAANLCLISLALSDLMFCIFAFMTMFLPADNIYGSNGLLLHYGVYSPAIINVFIMESTMLTVAMSLERYLAICFPLRQDIYLTTRRIKFVIGVTVFFSIGFNIPVLWRLEIVKLCDGRSDDVSMVTNATIDNLISMATSGMTGDLNQPDLEDQGVQITTPALVNIVFNVSMNANISIPSTNISLLESLTTYRRNSFLPALSPSSQASKSVSSDAGFSLRDNGFPIGKTTTLYTTRIVPLGGSHVYDVIYRVIWAVVGNFIPLILLFFFNVNLCRKIYRSYKLRRQLGRQVQTRSSSQNLTLTLVAIVVLFFILVAPSEVTLQISHMINRNDSPYYKNIEAVLNLMQSINFSVNFILYCIISPYFRKTLKFTILCGCYNVYQVSRHSKKEFETSLL